MEEIYQNCAEICSFPDSWANALHPIIALISSAWLLLQPLQLIAGPQTPALGDGFLIVVYVHQRRQFAGVHTGGVRPSLTL